MTWVGVLCGLLLVALLMTREVARAQHTSVRAVGRDLPPGDPPTDQHWTPSFPLVSLLALITAASLLPRLWGLLT